MSKSNGPSADSTAAAPALSSLSVSGFKSIVAEQTLDIRPLTLLAGSNSSGKSSMMQPLLLIKQTLESPYDPGPLALNGPYVRFTSIDQFWPALSSNASAKALTVTLMLSDGTKMSLAFRWDRNRRQLDALSTKYYINYHACILHQDTRPDAAVEFPAAVVPVSSHRAGVASRSLLLTRAWRITPLDRVPS